MKHILSIFAAVIIACISTDAMAQYERCDLKCQNRKLRKKVKRLESIRWKRAYRSLSLRHKRLQQKYRKQSSRMEALEADNSFLSYLLKMEKRKVKRLGRKNSALNKALGAALKKVSDYVVRLRNEADYTLIYKMLYLQCKRKCSR